MFLIERLVGVSAYCVILFCVLQLLLDKRMKYSQVLNGYTVILSIMGYLYVPYETADLYRIYEMIEIFSKYNWIEFVENIVVNTTSPLAYIMYWWIGKIGNPNLLPALVCFITYSCIFYIIKNTARKYQLSRSTIALTVFFIMSTGNYIMVISNIRTMLALVLICFCYFRETIMGKFKIWHLVVYLIAIFLHNLGLVILGMRVLVFAFRKKRTVSSYIVTILVISIILLGTLKMGTALVDSVFEKAMGYISGDKYSYIWDYIIATLVMIIELYVLRCYRKTSVKNNEFEEYKNFIILAIVIAIVFCFEFSIYHRLLTYFCPILIVPIMLYSLDNIQIHRKRRFNIIFLILLLQLGLSCIRGSMSSLKFFEL